MKVARVDSRCECQAHLCAELNEQHVALKGWAIDSRKQRLPAPANTLGPERERFDVGWACPFCTRNTLRSFTGSGLTFRESETQAS